MKGDVGRGGIHRGCGMGVIAMGRTKGGHILPLPSCIFGTSSTIVILKLGTSISGLIHGLWGYNSGGGERRFGRRGGGK